MTPVFLILLATAYIIPGLQAHPHDDSRSWLLFPGAEGPHLALLSGSVPVPAEEHEEANVRFLFYCRENPSSPLPMMLDDLSNVPFNPELKTKVIVHSYASSANESWVQEMKDELLRQSDCQVVVMDWSALVEPPLYHRAALRNVALAGDQLAQLLSSLVSIHEARYYNLHLLGHGLGAHLAGHAGRLLQRSQQRVPPALRFKLARITALDPVLPLFEHSTNARLTKDDANFVDVIHTCGGWLGIAEPIGHADFYPNAGVGPQPGCGADFSGCCSHSRSVQYFIESISEKAALFRALRCDSFSDFENNLCCDQPAIAMGLHVPRTEGTYFLSTADERPFALG